jgi:Ser/Thr protein kinase RdoA (MazF antagonist)
MDGIRQLILRHYDLDESTECTFFCRGVSDTYLVSASGRRFAFRVYRSNWRTREAIHYEMNALQLAGAQDVGVALPVPRRDGGLITDVRAPEGPRNAVLFHWAEGRAPKYTNPEHAFRYGQLLGRLHAVADALSPSDCRPELNMDYLFGSPMERLRPRVKNMPAVAVALDALAERIAGRLNEVEHRLPDWGFCHGDIWTNNARIDGERLVLLDFDFCGFGWRAFDLASYRWHARFTGVENAAWKPFLDGYLQARPAGAQSLPYMGLFMILKHLWTMAHFVRRAPETGASFLSEEDLESIVPFCASIEAEDTAGGMT